MIKQRTWSSTALVSSLILTIILLTACTSAQTPPIITHTQIIELPATETPVESPITEPDPDPSGEESSAATSTPTPTALPDLRPKPQSWQYWPIIPDLDPEMIEIYHLGQSLGRDPQIFSVIGDCQSSPTYFLSL